MKKKSLNNSLNETVSLGDTAVSLHTFLGRGGYSWLLITQSANFWATFHFQGGGVFLATQNSKSQVLVKFSFWGFGGEGWEGRYSWLPKFPFGGGQYCWQLKTQSPNFWPNFHGGGGGGWGILGQPRIGIILKMNQNSGRLTCSCIADSLSHIACVGD